jgi:ESS family glutamate:Na+ symporter
MMFPIAELDSDSLDALVFAVVMLGVLILAGVVLRMVFPVLRRLFLPAALIGGLVGLALGPYGVSVVPEPVVATWSSLPGVLATVVFAPMLIGVRLPRLRETYELVVPQLLFGYMGSALLIGIPLVISAVLLAPLWGVNAMFGSLVETGWPGGHGTAGAMTEVYEAQGWAAGGSLGLTSATVGLLTGIVVGMALVNWGARRGHLQRPISQDSKGADLIPEPERVPTGRVTLNKDLVDTVAFHLTLIAVAILIGLVLQHVINAVVPGMPLFPLAMIGGAVVQLIIRRTPLGAAVDTASLRTIQAVALDLLVVSAVAAIEVPVVVDNAAPLAVLMVVAAVVATGFFFLVGPRLFPRDWFEQSIVNYGSLTGVSSVGLMLLRTVDPDLETVAGTAYALRAPFLSPFIGGGLITAVVPLLAVTYGALTVGVVCLVLFVVMVVAARLLGFWTQPVPNQAAASTVPS